MISPQTGSVIADKYRLERMLARGGMGSVWLARHLQLDTNLAIKFMAPEYASFAEARARFEREAKAAAQLKTPNVVQIHDYGLEDDTPYIVMERLDGEDLEARLHREGRLSLSSTLTIVTQVCKALRQAHGAGLVHRDLKPANLFLARQAEEEIVKVLDFGIAKLTNPERAGPTTKTGTLLGSPHYMSPEQVRYRKDIDHRSDLWSLGVIVFRCVTGELPFQSEVLGDLFVAICSDPIAAASQIARDLGPEVDGFLFRALRRAPEERFQSASEFADAFAQVVGSRASIPPGTEIATVQPPWLAAGELPPQPTGGSTLPAFGEVPATVAPSSPAPHAVAAPSPGPARRRAAEESDGAASPRAISTLSPSGQTLISSLTRGRARLSLSLLGGVLLGVIVVIILFRPFEPAVNSSPPTQAGAPPSAAEPAPVSPPAARSVEPAKEAQDSSPLPALAAAVPSAIPSASVTAPARLREPPQRPSPPKKAKPVYDPRDHL